MKMKKFVVAALAFTMTLSAATTAFAATPVYENGFDGSLGGAQVVTRVGDNDDGANAGTVPTADTTIEAQFQEGKNGQALYLDGKYGIVLDAKAVGETYSVAFWMNPARFSNFGPMVQIGSDLLSANASSTWLNITKTDWVGDVAPVIWSRNETNGAWPWYQTAYFAGNVDAPMQLNKNEWNHVVVTVDSTKVGMDPVLATEVAGTFMSQLYINGEFIGEGPVASGTFANDESKIYLGINAWDIIFKGLFDDFKVYNTALTADEVKVAMNEAAGTAAPAEAVEATETATEAPATSVPSTGVTSMAFVFGLGAALLGGSAVVLKKKKN